MPYVQKEEDLDANPQVQTDQRGTMALVPEAPLVLYVNMPFLQFQNPNTRINNPADDLVYVVTEENGELTIDTVPLVVNQ